MQTVDGEGMPVFEGNGHGDLFVEYNIVLPTSLTPELRRSKRSILEILHPPLTISTELTEAFHGSGRPGRDEL